jgi:hypothetical protein
MEHLTSALFEAVNNLDILTLREELQLKIEEVKVLRNTPAEYTTLTEIYRAPNYSATLDTLYYFTDITKEFRLSIADNLEKIENNRVEWQKTSVEMEELRSAINALHTRLFEEIKFIVELISDYDLYSRESIADEPLVKLYRDILAHQNVSFYQISQVLSELNYRPKCMLRSSEHFFIAEGNYEEYLQHRDGAIALMNHMESEAFHNLNLQFAQLEEKKTRLEKENRLCRQENIKWRESMMECFDISYDTSLLNIHSLMAI